MKIIITSFFLLVVKIGDTSDTESFPSVFSSVESVWWDDHNETPTFLMDESINGTYKIPIVSTEVSDLESSLSSISSKNTVRMATEAVQNCNGAASELVELQQRLEIKMPL